MSDDELFYKIDDLMKKSIRHLIESDGGRITLHSVSNNVVYVKLSGACAHCAAIQYTLKGSVERIIKQNYPEILRVELAR